MRKSLLFGSIFLPRHGRAPEVNRQKQQPAQKRKGLKKNLRPTSAQLQRQPPFPPPTLLQWPRVTTVPVLAQLALWLSHVWACHVPPTLSYGILGICHYE
jgi:hypothetical protein